MNIEQYISSGIIESYVLGLTSVEESREVEQMASIHPDVQVAIESYQKTMEEFAGIHAVTPPAGLKDRIVKAIADENKDASLAKNRLDEKGEKESLIRILQRWKWVAAAAIILLVASLVFNGIYIGKYRQYKERYTALVGNQQQLVAHNRVIETRLEEVEGNMKMLMNPAMKPVVMKGLAQHPDMVATVYWDSQSRHAYMGTSNLPIPPAGKDYQLWAIVDGKPVNMGLYHPAKAKGPVEMNNVIPGKVQAFAITLERQGGSPTPTMDQMYVIGKI